MKKHSSLLNCGIITLYCFKHKMRCRISSFSWSIGESLYMTLVYFFFCTCWWYFLCRTSILTQTFLLIIRKVRSLWRPTTWNVSNITKRKVSLYLRFTCTVSFVCSQDFHKKQIQLHTNNDLKYLVIFKLKLFSIFKKLNMKYRGIKIFWVTFFLLYQSDTPEYCIKVIHQNIVLKWYTRILYQSDAPEYCIKVMHQNIEPEYRQEVILIKIYTCQCILLKVIVIHDRCPRDSVGQTEFLK